jgi:hypothetical protein
MINFFCVVEQAMLKFCNVNSLFSAEEDDVTVQLYEKPVPETDFVRHCAQRRKYPILLKVIDERYIEIRNLY